jgi:hypothetical protein
MGAADVAMNSLAGRAEQLSNTPVLLRSGGVFSASVVVSSAATGLSTWLAAPIHIPFAVAAVFSVAVGALVLKALPRGIQHDEGAAIHPSRSTAPGPRLRRLPLLLIGALGALAFATENAHQSWGAVFLADELQADTGLGAIAPAVFAGTVAITRFSLGRLRPGNETLILLGGSATAALGALVIAVSPTLPLAIAGLVVAAAGTAALFPVLLSLVSRGVSETHRGRATSIVTTVAYLGFILGPVYVGALSEAVGLRGAFAAVAALGVILVVVARPLLRVSGFVHGWDSESPRTRTTRTTRDTSICNSRPR